MATAVAHVRSSGNDSCTVGCRHMGAENVQQAKASLVDHLVQGQGSVVVKSGRIIIIISFP